MHLSVIIYTTNKKLWVKDQLGKVYETLRTSPGLTFQEPFTVEYMKLPDDVPVVKEYGTVRPDWAWFKEHCPRKGHTAVCLHISTSERDQLGLKHPDPQYALGGIYLAERMDSDGFQFLVIADKHAMSYDGMTEFERIFLHELSHGFANWRGATDYTHLWDQGIKMLPLYFVLHDFSVWNVWADKLIKLMAKLKPQKDTVPPLDEQWMKSITQEYGVPNSAYPQTRHHVGIDYAVPSGERCYAIADGEIVKSGKTADLGNYIHYRFTRQGQTYTARYLHLSHRQPLGKYKKGDVVGQTGNTGKSTGPHLHIDAVKGDFDLTGITPMNFRSKFIDPRTLWT